MTDTPVALDRRAASVALGFAPGSRWLTRPGSPIPKHDIRRPGALKPRWVWWQHELAAFVDSRRVEPGHPNPQER